MNINFFRTMLSLSKSEFGVIGFLIRNFSKRFTIRNIGAELKISAAGAHSVLKKLEKNNIVKAERLGTGLFYDINLGNKVAEHLVACTLLNYFSLKKMETKELEKESSAIIFDGKSALAITSNEEIIKDAFYKINKDINVICRGKEDFIEGIKDKEILDILQKGNVLFGEGLVIEAIRKVMR